MKRIMFKASPELSDGERCCTYRDINELCNAIREYAANYNSVHDEGETFSVELVVMTDAEYESLPEI